GDSHGISAGWKAAGRPWSEKAAWSSLRQPLVITANRGPGKDRSVLGDAVPGSMLDDSGVGRTGHAPPMQRVVRAVQGDVGLRGDLQVHAVPRALDAGLNGVRRLAQRQLQRVVLAEGLQLLGRAAAD